MVMKRSPDTESQESRQPYNHATSNSAIYSHVISQDKLSEA